MLLTELKQINLLKINSDGTIFDIPIETKGLFDSCDLGYLESKWEVNLENGLVLSKDKPIEGTECWMVGLQGSHQNEGNISLNLYKYHGTIVSYYENGTGILRNPCYQCDYIGGPGSSSGPVFNSNNEVIGIHSTGFKGAEGLSFMTPFYDFIRKDYP